MRNESNDQIYIQRGREWFVTDQASTVVHEHLPTGTYRLQHDPLRGWSFASIDDFDIPPKLYGDLTSRARRIWTTYCQRRERGVSTGVLLAGSKGSGKTLLAKVVGIQSRLPVVVINDPYTSDDFKEIISRLGECVVIFDEFEKVYRDEDAQSQILTLLDGVFSLRSLIFVIVNDTGKMLDHFLNRPGRIYYALEYGGLERDFIEEYCRDNLDDPAEEKIMGVLTVSTMFEHFSFDQLQALVEEMNRFEETAQESIKFLNVKSSYFKEWERYEVTAWIDTDEIEIPKSLRDWRGHPLNVSMRSVSFEYTEEDEEGDEMHRWFDVSLSEENIVHVDPSTEEFVFAEGDRRVRFRKKGVTSYVA